MRASWLKPERPATLNQTYKRSNQKKGSFWKPDLLVNSMTENRKMFEGSSRLRKGKITATDDN